MRAPEPIDAYLRELERELRVRGVARRRILAELRAHLLDAAEAEQSTGAAEGLAAHRAVVRFGVAADTAHEFNRLAGRRGAVLRRALVPWVAAVALTLTASATVWAFQAGPAAPRPPLAHPARRAPCALRATRARPVRARDERRASSPAVSRARAVCGAHAGAR
jgi:hypothetical protein